MNNIIRFKKYNRKRDDTMKFEKLIKDLETKNKNHHEYSLNEIIQIANAILDKTGYYTGRCATQIVKISKEFDFKIYKEKLKNGKSGDIQVNGLTKEKYVYDKIILVNKKDELFHQRFVVAHELAHYLFDFLGNPNYSDPNVIFVDTYEKDHHDKPEEKRANIFAAEIMMPRDLFIKQYYIAKHEENKPIFISTYLSEFFETSIDSIEKRIKEVFA